jgi:flavin reductase (DIM6/NTAB) family NADH-FMN oxidoreductase RutF
LNELADPAMVVVTARSGERRGGCLVGFHSQCSIEPVRYAVWMSKANLTTEIVLDCTHIGVHFLTDADDELADLFGSETGDQVDKFSFISSTDGPHGVPTIDDLPNRFVARRTAVLEDESDHLCVIVEPLDIRALDSPGSPLRTSAVADLQPGHVATDRRD